MTTIGSLDDNIAKLRGILGIVYGIIAYIFYRLGIVLIIDCSATVWILAGIVYIASGFYVQKKYGVSDIWHVFLRGIVTYYGAWLVVFFMLYDLLG